MEIKDLRVLHVMAGGDYGGAETAFVDMCIAMRERGVQVQAATRSQPDRVQRLLAHDVDVETMRFGSKVDFATKRKLKRQILDFKPHIIQSWMARASSFVPDAGKVKGHKSYLKMCRLGGYYKLKYFKNYDAYIHIAPDIGRYLHAQGVEKSKLFHINNFAETEEVGTQVERVDLDTPRDAPVFLSLSRLHDAKALDVFVRAAAQVDGAYLWLAGEGPDREKLEELARDMCIEDRVRFLGWRNDRAALLAAADYCCFPSRHEPFGTVFVQAWMNKVPLIVSKAQGPSQFVRDGVDGLMFDIDDVDGLAQVMKRAISDKDLCASMVDKGYQRYLGEFTKDKSVQDYLDLYMQKLQENGMT